LPPVKPALTVVQVRPHGTSGIALTCQCRGEPGTRPVLVVKKPAPHPRWFLCRLGGSACLGTWMLAEPGRRSGAVGACEDCSTLAGAGNVNIGEG